MFGLATCQFHPRSSRTIRRLGRCTLAAALAAAMLLPAPLGAEPLNWQQRKELFMEGTIADEDGNTWRIRILPGAHRIDRGRGVEGRGTTPRRCLGRPLLYRHRVRPGSASGGALARASLADFWFKGI
jgi:hypothetical protein